MCNIGILIKGNCDEFRKIKLFFNWYNCIDDISECIYWWYYWMYLLVNIIFYLLYLDFKFEGLIIYLFDIDVMIGMGKFCGMNNRILIWL